MDKCLIYHPFLNVRGGAERVVENLLTALLDLGYDAYILTMTSVNSHPLINKYYEFNKDKVIIHSTIGSESHFKGLLNRIYYHTLFYLNNLVVVNESVNRLKPKLIIGSCEDLQDIVALSFVTYPVILYIHNPFWENLRSPYKAFFKLLRNKIRSKTVLSNSKFLARDLCRVLGVKSHVLYPSYDDGLFKPNPRIKDPNCILMVGRISPEKRHHLGIEAAYELKKRDVEFKLNIVGHITDKNYYYYLEKLISNFSLEKNCKIFPFMEAETIKQYYQKATAYWNFSLGYFGITNIEAMACGAIPFVTPNCAELIVDGYNGFVCSSKIEFANKTGIILKNQRLAGKIAKHAIEYAGDFSFSNFVNRLKTTLDCTVKISA